MNSDLDKGIERTWMPRSSRANLRKGVSYAVKSGVVTLTGEVDSQSKRREVAKVVVPFRMSSRW